MSHVTSKDGTSIAYDRMGSGPAPVGYEDSVIMLQAGTH